MAAANNCNHSSFELITKLAKLALQDERGQTQDTAANIADIPLPTVLVAKKRSQIYESLLHSSASASSAPCPQLESLPQYEKALKCNCLDTKMVNNIARCLLSLSTPMEENMPEKPKVDDKPASKAAPFEMPLLWSNRRKLPQPISLLTSSDAMTLQSVGEMRRLLKPLDFHRQSNIMLSDIDKLRDSFNSQKENRLLGSVLGESLERIRESKRKLQRMKPNLPLHENKITVNDSIINRSTNIQSGCEKNFISDKNVSNELKWSEDPSVCLDIIEQAELIDHLKKVSAGLQSETFLYTTDGVFCLRANTSLKSVLPEVLADYAQPFLHSGNAFRCLTARTQWCHSSERVELPMTRTLRQAITIILANTRLFLLSQPASNFSELLRSATPTMQLLRQLEQLHINASSLRRGESGAKLLSYIWSAIDQSVNSGYQHMLIYLLRALCQTYFDQLHSWLYQGEIDEPFNELFVSCCSERALNRRSKEYFDRGFHVRSDMVPNFLAGYERAILQCGKYNRLLRTYREEHLIFSLKQPELVVCLSDQELKNMQQILEQHYKQILQNTKPFNIKSFFEERSASKQNFANRMQSCTEKHIADWDLHQRELQLKANEEKRIRNKLLQEQWDNAQQVRIDQQRKNIVNELAHQEECDKLEEESLCREKQELQKKISDVPKDLVAKVLTPVSPDESTCSYVSCLEESNPDEALSDTPENTASLPHQVDVELDKRNLNDNASQNRERNMSSEQFKSCQTMVQLQKKSTNATTSEAMCNRLRVLNCTDLHTQLPPDMNMNVEELSDLQRNRLRMHHHNEFSSINSNEDESSGIVKPTLECIQEKDLRKDLQLPLERIDAISSTILDPQTPMSTTSDIEIDLFKETIPATTFDAVNNNIQEDNEDLIEATAGDEQPVLNTTGQSADQLKETVNKKSILSLPGLQMQKKTEEDSWLKYSRSGGNTFMIKHFVKQSIAIPVRMHLSFLRNEVLRILHELNIYEHLLHLRNYFFLLDGDFGIQLVGGILRNIEAGMEPRGICQKGILDSILNNALSSKVSDCIVRAEMDAGPQITENLTLNCSNIPESFDLTNIDVLSAFTLHWKVDWPLNLVINVESVAKYKQIFSYLLKLRYVSCILDRSYQYLQEVGKQHGRSILLSPQYRHLQVMRYKLSHFLITLQNHLDTNVFQVAWQQFNQNLHKVDSIEEMYQRHVEYLKQVAFLSLLNRQSSKFRDSINAVLVIILRFCKNLHAQTFVLDNEQQQYVHPRYKSLLHDEAEFEKFVHYVIYLAKKIAASGYQDKILELVRNLNFNNYYNVSTQLAEVSF